MNMKIIILAILTLYLTLMMVSADCALPSVVWTDLFQNKEIEKPSFDTPSELRSHLDNLSHYYAVVGRPRFGKRNIDKNTEALKNLRKYIPSKYWDRLAQLLDVKNNLQS